jgi:GxxExxY protein
MNCGRLASRWSRNLTYKDVKLEGGYRLDLVREDSVILEIKSIKHLAPIHDAQLLAYLRISNMRVGLIINFHVRVLKNGLKRILNDHPDSVSFAVSAENKNAKV